MGLLPFWAHGPALRTAATPQQHEPGTCWRFVILGPPATKKNSLRIVTRKSDGRSFVMPSLSAKGWEKTAVEQLRTQFVRGVPIDQAVRMDAVIYRQRATGDLLNYLAAVSDALERAGVIVNDKQIIRLDGCRLEKDAANPRVEVDVIVI